MFQKYFHPSNKFRSSNLNSNIVEDVDRRQPLKDLGDPTDPQSPDPFEATKSTTSRPKAASPAIEKIRKAKKSRLKSIHRLFKVQDSDVAPAFQKRLKLFPIQQQQHLLR
jgi:hypothetical protein